jgi:predicted transcriptional regulator
MTINIDADQKRALHKLSEKSGVPMSVMLRKGVDLALAWYEEREELIEKGLRAEEREP